MPLKHHHKLHIAKKVGGMDFGADALPNLFGDDANRAFGNALDNEAADNVIGNMIDRDIELENLRQGSQTSQTVINELLRQQESDNAKLKQYENKIASLQSSAAQPKYTTYSILNPYYSSLIPTPYERALLAKRLYDLEQPVVKQVVKPVVIRQVVKAPSKNKSSSHKAKTKSPSHKNKPKAKSTSHKGKTKK